MSLPLPRASVTTYKVEAKTMCGGVICFDIGKAELLEKNAGLILPANTPITRIPGIGQSSTGPFGNQWWLFAIRTLAFRRPAPPPRFPPPGFRLPIPELPTFPQGA